VCRSIVVKEKPTVGSPFLGGFPSERIHKTTKDVNLNVFIRSFTSRDELVMNSALAIKNYYKLYQRIPGAF
jgi:hypothetical protein